MKKKDFGMFAIVFGLIVGVSGCAMNNSELSKATEEVTLLNERQKSILAEQGLATNYDGLTASQQEAIVAIEEMLQYAENKYDMNFSYAGYVTESSLEKEHMRAYPASGDKAVDCFTITKTSDGYTDDYISVAANQNFCIYVCDGVKGLSYGIDVKVFAEITSTSLKEIPSVGDAFDGNIEGSLWIFIDETSLSGDKWSDFVAEFKEWMEGHSLYGVVQMILLKENNIKYITRYNYVDYLSEEYYKSREVIYINK